jgi:photosystem II stability/assembly factor-like uncharacterized protein
MPARAMRYPLGVLVLTLLVALARGESIAHDASAWGGLFRTRDAGATWLPANPASFVSGALAVAVSPVDPHHLLLATDTGLSRSHNGGRDWNLEARDVLVGPAFAVAFDVDGQRALVAGASELFWSDGDRWRPLRAPAGAVPAWTLVSSSTRGRAYMGGLSGLHRSDDWGESWIAISGGLPEGRVSAIVVNRDGSEQVGVVAGGRFWTSTDAGRSWQRRDLGLSEREVEVVALDPGDPNRLWSIAAGQVFCTDDRGQRWRSLGVPLPDQPVIAHEMAVVEHVILVATDRGLYRSADDGARWSLLGDNLPAHLDAGLLAREPRSLTTMYAGFALTPRRELFRRAAEGSGPLARLDLVNVAGGLAFFALLLLAAGLVIKRLARTHYRAPRSVSR